MANSCFRCKAHISSGETFCEPCNQEVSLVDLAYRKESQVWIVIAFVPVWLVLKLLLYPLLAPWMSRWILIGWSMVTFVSLLAFMWAIVVDAEHIRNRDDTDWNPSKVVYWSLAAICLIFVMIPIPFVAAYHLYRRHRTIGFPPYRS